MIDLEVGAADLGPLAWVTEELRKSLDSANKALKRFSREADALRGSDLAAVDTSQLRIARTQIHQALGALEMVGLEQASIMLRAMESAVQVFVNKPQNCNEKAVAALETASFAVMEYLDASIAGRTVSSVGLFPQYRDVQALAGVTQVHPSDLWPHAFRLTDCGMPVSAPEPLQYGEIARRKLDQAVLSVMRGNLDDGAASLSSVASGLAIAETRMQGRCFWQVVTAFAQALSTRQLLQDVYLKRSLPGIVAQYVALGKPEGSIQDKTVRELLFFCAQADPVEAAGSGVFDTLNAVRMAYHLHSHKLVNYEQSHFGSFDPAILAQARKRLASAKEVWASYSGGDRQKGKAVVDQISLVCDSLGKLRVPADRVSHSFQETVRQSVQGAQLPSAEVGMEVATVILYLEAMLEDFDPASPHLADRLGELADRLETVRQGGVSPALTPWMEDLYHRFSERGTLGSVVGELRSTLTELEKSLDVFFRDISQASALADVPGRLGQMRGVLSVLGVDPAALAVVRLREWVEQIIAGEIDPAVASAKGGIFERIGNSLGALGFLIDMLGYQPNLVKKLFQYDAESGELSPIMGRTGAISSGVGRVADMPQQSTGNSASGALDLPDLSIDLEATPSVETVAVAMASQPVAKVATPVPPRMELPPEAADSTFEEDDLLGIFLEEAHEVMSQAQDALVALEHNPSDMEVRTSLRRAFHTLKGSSRMVGLTVFGEAAWAMEQAHNASLAESGPIVPELLQLSRQALDGLAQWVSVIEQGGMSAEQPSAEPYKMSAEAWRLHSQLIPIDVVTAEQAPVVQEPEAPSMFLADELPTPSTAADVPVDFSFELPGSDDAEPPLELDVTAPLPDVQSLLAPAEAQAPALPAMKNDELPREEAPPVPDFSFDLDLSDEPVGAATDMDLEPEPVFAEAGSLVSTVPDVSDVSLSVQNPQIAESPESIELTASDTPMVPEFAPVEPSLISEESVDNVKVIGDLRINLALYNVFLSEADEWSRRLQEEISELELEQHRQPAESSVAWAHSLAGSSGTVGFESLSNLSREFEAVLLHAQKQSYRSPETLELFVETADEIRRLLHQFAAGFLATEKPGLMDRLSSYLQTSESEPSQPDPFEVDASLTPATGGMEVIEISGFDAPADDPVPAVSEPALASEEVSSLRSDLMSPVGAPAIPSAALLADQDEQIDVLDAIDPDLFPIFEEEALELMPNLGAALRQWSTRVDNLGARTEALRLMHTIKGSARLAGALRMGELIHLMESQVEHMGTAVQSADVEPLLTDFDHVSNLFEALRNRDAQAYQAAMDEASAAPGSLPSVVEATSVAAEPAGAAPAAQVRVPEAVQPAGTALKVHTPAALVVKQNTQTVRVKANLLDRLVNQAGEVMMTRSRLEAEVNNLRGSLSDLTANLEKLRLQLRDIELQAESQMQSRMAQAKEAQANFDPLEFDRFTRVQELTRMMAESVNDVATVQRNLHRTLQDTEDDLIDQARQTRELQRDLLRTRMVEFEGISERLYRVVRLASKETGKQVRLDITGGNIEMDRGMLDRMTPAFEHLLRNCVAHGVEDAQTRIQAGKDPVGLVSIALSQEGNDVTVEFRDDGAGLNIARIRDKAQNLGLIQPGEQITDAQAGEMIFMPGFSTAAEVTELAGRGIGMDVVRSEIYALGGRIDTSTQSGRGTAFKLVLPLTTAVTQVVLVRSGSLVVGVPSTMVEIVRRAAPRELELAYNSGQFDLGQEQSIPFFWSGALLQASPRSLEPVGRTTPVVIFRSAAQRAAVHVDEVLGNQEVVVKNLGAQLSRLPGLAGMTLLPSGAVVLIYNPVALATVYGDLARAMSADHAQPHVLEEQAVNRLPESAVPVPRTAAPSSVVPLVLVVDDSITVRKVTQRLLSREGYRVALAADGLQALERLQEELPAVVLSDIEMPRMDGFDLARNIRGDARMKHLPIVMITSRMAEKHREHAVSLGVNHYLGKPYSEEELLSLVKHYCTQDAEV